MTDELKCWICGRPVLEVGGLRANTCGQFNCVAMCASERNALRTRLARAKELLREVVGSGVTCDDARLDYKVMQIDNVTLKAIEAFLKE